MCIVFCCLSVVRYVRVRVRVRIRVRVRVRVSSVGESKK